MPGIHDTTRQPPVRTYAVGVGMTRFEKPGARQWDCPDMGREATEEALADAGLAFAGCVLALGFDKMARGSLGGHVPDPTSPVDRHFVDMIERRGLTDVPPTVQLFAHVAREYVERWGIDPLTQLQCCPTSDGGAAAVLASERFVEALGLCAEGGANCVS